MRQSEKQRAFASASTCASPTNALVANWLTLAALTGYPANAAQPEQIAITCSTTSSAAH